MSTSLTEDEAKLYDRQIRLWGVDAQKRMRESKILLVGLRALNSEVCKNLVLAGVNSVTLLDHASVTPIDLGAQIFLEAVDIGINRGKASIRNISLLNPLVNVECDEDHIENKNEEYFKQFKAVCLTNCTIDQLVRVDGLCRKNGIYFFAADTFGQLGYFFSDLGKYVYTKKVEGEAVSEIIETQFSSLEEAVSLESWQKLRAPILFFGIQFLYQFQKKFSRLPQPMSDTDRQELVQISKKTLKDHNMSEDFVSEDFIKSLAVNATAELSPVCAILGGILGQEVIKVISGKDEALNNFFFYNALNNRNPGETAIIPTPSQKQK